MYPVGEGTWPCPFPVTGNGHERVTEPQGDHLSGRILWTVPKRESRGEGRSRELQDGKVSVPAITCPRVAHRGRGAWVLASARNVRSTHSFLDSFELRW